MDGDRILPWLKRRWREGKVNVQLCRASLENDVIFDQHLCRKRYHLSFYYLLFIIHIIIIINKNKKNDENYMHLLYHGGIRSLLKKYLFFYFYFY